MASEIVNKIKVGYYTSEPASLREGELAYSFASGTLFIGGPNNTIETVTSQATLTTLDTIEPTSPVDGSAWLDTSNNQLNIYRNGAWDRVVFKAEAEYDYGNVILNCGYF